ncbi:CRAL/TRIO domain protein [Dictyocaulus viviparus]|uniref:CRAL/TRIO domain protein n=1 Tax=Dictyocaulus viviparus TaxID=29172 RepID=A0A0D8Y8S6_DICVI|nr:CRAL/TRIO domain protein [Dictyocaulus viviparus]
MSLQLFFSLHQYKMTIHSTMKAAEPISQLETEMVNTLRCRLIETLKRIPDDLNTDLNLVRWIRGYQGNIDGICKDVKLQNFAQYVASREAAGFVGRDLPEKYFEMATIKPFLPFIASSRLGDSVWYDEKNAFMFVERAWSQPREFIKTFKASDYLLHCFGYSELLLQLILERERKQSKDRGPVQFIVIFDLATVNITDYVNPMSGYMKLWQLRSEMWQDWYPDVVQRIYLVNPPRLVSLLWKIARLFLTEQNLRKIEIVGDKEMIKHVNKSYVPKEYGGDFVNKDLPGDESGVSIRRKITSADHYRAYQHYVLCGVQRPKSAKKDISPGESFILPIIVPEGKSLLWDFTTSSEIEFFIYKDKDENHLFYPRLRLITAKLAEEGILRNLPGGEYRFVFANHGTYFTTKLEYAITLA